MPPMAKGVRGASQDRSYRSRRKRNEKQKAIHKERGRERKTKGVGWGLKIFRHPRRDE